MSTRTRKEPMHVSMDPKLVRELKELAAYLGISRNAAVSVAVRNLYETTFPSRTANRAAEPKV